MKKCKLLNSETGEVQAATRMGNEHFSNAEEEQTKTIRWVDYIFPIPFLSQTF